MVRSVQRFCVSGVAVVIACGSFLIAPASAVAPCDFCSYECHELTQAENDSDCELMCPGYGHAHCGSSDDCDGQGAGWYRVYCYEDQVE